MSILPGVACVAAGVFVLVLLNSGIRLLIADLLGSCPGHSFLSLTGSCTGGASSHVYAAARGTGAPGALTPESAPRVDDSSARLAP